jgi:type IV pilus assembly protein PilC
MPTYAYKALNPSGATNNSRIEATSEAQARSMLRLRGEHIVSLRELSSGQANKGAGARGKKPSPDEVATTIRQLSIMIRAGVPLVEGLAGLAEQTKSPVLTYALTRMANDVSQGGALSECFAQHPNVFPSLAVEMAGMAEAGGNLAESLSKLADHLERGAEITRKVKGALAYPAVVMCISVATVLVMVTFILPRFTKLFKQMGAQVPWTTQMLISLSHAVTTYWYLFIGGAVGISYLTRRFLRTPTGKRKFDALALKLPVVGDVVNKIVLSRVLACMSTLLGSGVPMLKALETAGAAANNEIVKDALLKASREVAEGNATSQSLRSAGLFPPLVLQMVASGEKTGELPAMLEYVCTLYDRETEAKVKSLTSIIEPIMIVVLGVIVGFIAMSVIVPIYSLVGGVK